MAPRDVPSILRQSQLAQMTTTQMPVISLSGSLAVESEMEAKNRSRAQRDQFGGDAAASEKYNKEVAAEKKVIDEIEKKGRIDNNDVKKAFNKKLDLMNYFAGSTGTPFRDDTNGMTNRIFSQVFTKMECKDSKTCVYDYIMDRELIPVEDIDAQEAKQEEEEEEEGEGGEAEAGGAGGVGRGDQKTRAEKLRKIICKKVLGENDGFDIKDCEMTEDMLKEVANTFGLEFVVIKRTSNLYRFKHIRSTDEQGESDRLKNKNYDELVFLQHTGTKFFPLSVKDEARQALPRVSLRRSSRRRRRSLSRRSRRRRSRSRRRSRRRRSRSRRRRRRSRSRKRRSKSRRRSRSRRRRSRSRRR